MKKSIGLMGMIGGGLCLSLEIYTLSIIQALDKISGGSWYTNSWYYAKSDPCIAALLLTVCIIIASVVIFAVGKDE